MQQPINDELLVHYYSHYIKLLDYAGTTSEYCRTNNIEYTQFAQFVSKLNPWCGRYAGVKDKELELVYLYRKSGQTKVKFCEKHDISPSRINSVVSHLNKIKRLKTLAPNVYQEFQIKINGQQDIEQESEHKENELSFIPITENKQEPEYKRDPESELTHKPMVHSVLTNLNQSPSISSITYEVVIPKNDIELTIKKGVTITVKPELETNELLKTIEFLRSL